MASETGLGRLDGAGARSPPIEGPERPARDALWAMYGRPPRGKGILAFVTVWSGAGMYPASNLRRIMPRALMKSADRVPFRFARSCPATSLAARELPILKSSFQSTCAKTLTLGCSCYSYMG